MSVTRGTFLKSLGKSLPGMVLGSGVGAAAQKLLGKLAAVPGMPGSHETIAQRDAIQQALADVVHHGPAEGNRVALTFDDGPTPGVTDRILDELKARNLHATFFMIGQCVAASPDLARRVVAEGHLAGNHTYTHRRLTELSDTQAAEEILKTQDLMADVLNVRPVWFRPPFGLLNHSQNLLLSSHGLRVVMWNVDTRDWSKPGVDQILAHVANDTKPGAIILCHDKFVQTADALPRILDHLAECDLSAVTMPALLAS
jgi:peptidoglycan-N-acetylglucosamine deacetylase